jgi:hypothetical protein
VIYLYWYLGLGVAVFAVVFLAHRLTKKDESVSFRDLLDAAKPDRKTLSYRILNNYVVPVFAALLVVVAWPVVIYMKVKEIFSTKQESAQNADREFAVERCHLQERLTIPQIEAREMVADPLGAVPNLPFGHLNATWRIFVEGVGAEDKLWSFTAPWEAAWGRKDLRSGYVLVRGGTPGPHFLTVKKEIE